MDNVGNERSNAFRSAMEVIDSNMELICKYFEGNEMKSAITDLRDTFLSFQTLQADWTKHTECMKKLEEKVEKDQYNTSINVEKEYEILLEKSNNISYDNENKSKEFDRKVNKCVAKKQDNDVLETESVVTLIDPISKKTMKNPVKNVHCKHSYDLDTIKFMIESKKGRGMKCPYQGCANTIPISVNDLIKDEVAVRKLQKMSQAN